MKEYYFFLDSTPTHSYMKALYKYPQRAFPYTELVAENRRRGRSEPEYELLDTGVFTEDRYFDVMVEYAKADPEDILIRMTATNRGPGSAPLHLLPTLWFRNTWAWGYDNRRPELRTISDEGTIHQAPTPCRSSERVWSGSLRTARGFQAWCHAGMSRAWVNVACWPWCAVTG